MRPIVLLLLIGIAVAMAGRHASSQDLRPGIIGKDDRVRLDEQGPPWDAVGQVNVGGYRMTDQCTGILAAPNLVVTAAHCVMNPWSLKPYPLHDIHFIAGVRGAASKGHATALCLHFPKDYRFVPPEKILPTMPAQKVPLGSFTTDVVAIVLGSRLDVAPAPLAGGVIAQPGLPLVHVAYAADHRFMPWAHFDCHLLGSDPEVPLWFNDCDTHPGSSGGPLFVSADGTHEVAAIMLGGGGHDFNVALPVSQWLELTRNTKCP
jgi:protease YdgD